jgi:hypothetical protein
MSRPSSRSSRNSPQNPSPSRFSSTRRHLEEPDGTIVRAQWRTCTVFVFAAEVNLQKATGDQDLNCSACALAWRSTSRASILRCGLHTVAALRTTSKGSHNRRTSRANAISSLSSKLSIAANDGSHEWLVPLNQRHSTLILNAPPTREGRLAPNVVSRLAEIGRAWTRPGPSASINEHTVITTPNLATGKPIHASFYPDPNGPDLANDGNFESSWYLDEGLTADWLEVDLRKEQS